jgi:hypothetical protein
MPLILLVIGIVMIIYNYRAIKRENEEKQEDNSLNISFQSVLQDNKNELNDYKMEIGLLRRDIAESLTELQGEIFGIKNNLNRLKSSGKIYENKVDLEDDYYIEENEIDINGNSENNKFNNEKEEMNEIKHVFDELDKNIVDDKELNDGIISEINFSEKADSNKTQRIKRLLKDGLTEEQICHELSVSKGEVLLVKGLFKK